MKMMNGTSSNSVMVPHEKHQFRLHVKSSGAAFMGKEKVLTSREKYWSLVKVTDVDHNLENICFEITKKPLVLVPCKKQWCRFHLICTVLLLHKKKLQYTLLSGWHIRKGIEP